MEDELTQRELIETLNQKDFITRRGKPITAYTLTYWQSKGAIPRPKRSRRGIGMGTGAKYVYLSSVIAQIKCLVDSLDEKRSLNYAIVNLWLQGYEVKYKPVLLNGIKKYAKWWRSLRSIEDGEIVLSKKAENMIARRTEGRSKRHRSEIMASASRRTQGQFYSFKSFLIRLIAGTDDLLLYQDDVDAFLTVVDLAGYSPLHGLPSGQILLNLSRMCSPIFLEELIYTGPEYAIQLYYLLFGQAIEVLDEFASVKDAIKDFPIFTSTREDFISQIKSYASKFKEEPLNDRFIAELRKPRRGYRPLFMYLEPQD